MFDVEADRYDAWFDRPDGKILFANELAALRLLWRETFHPALEIGVGTGRFAQALGVEHGVDPAGRALALASARGVKTICGRGEALPFSDASFSGVLLVTALGFTACPVAVLREAARVLRPGGHVLVGEIPRDSIWGRSCLHAKHAGDPFFARMRMFTVDEFGALLIAAGFKPVAFASTLIQSTPDSPQPEKPQLSCVDGAGFVSVLAARSDTVTQCVTT